MSTDTQKISKTNERKKGWLPTLFQLLFALVFLGCAVGLSSYYLNSPPKAKPRQRTPVAPLVTVTSLESQDIEYEFDAMGTVTSAREIGLTSQVGGEIVGMSDEFVPGGYFSVGEELITIDPTDYKLAMLQLESALAKTKSDLNLEMGNQRIALKEFEILGEEVSDTEKQLMLRAPQLETARANVASAEAQLEKAQLDLARTRIRAPFNGVVLSRAVNLGSRVTTSTALAQVAGTDQFWIKVNVPVNQLQWLKIPRNGNENGSSARIYLSDTGGETYRSGKIIRLAPDLEEQGRMAIVYVMVEDPLCLKSENNDKAKLLLGSFVRVRFEGKKLTGVNVISRDHVHEGNTLWFLADDNSLSIEPVEIIAKNEKYIYTAADQNQNRKLITATIASPTAGAPLQTVQPGNKGGNGKEAKRQPEAAETNQ